MCKYGSSYIIANYKPYLVKINKLVLRLISKESKINLYNTYLRLITIFGYERWSTIKGDER